MPIEWSGLAPDLLLALDRRSGDPLRSHDLRRRVTLRNEPGAANGGLVDRLSLILPHTVEAYRTPGGG